MQMKLQDGKSKVFTLSYDDGVLQDIRLSEIMAKCGIKGTFNINTGLYLSEDVERKRERIMHMRLSEAQALYTNSGNEVAVHAYTHQRLEKMAPDAITAEIITDRKNIEKQYGTIARGMAYPFGAYSDCVIDTLEKCGICYSRTTKSTERFDFPKRWLALDPTCHHNNPKLMELARKFVEENVGINDNQMFYLWGHSYEFDVDNNWNVIEEFCEYLGGRDDIWYATNIEIYDYVKAYENLQCSVVGDIVHNPSAIDVWFAEGGKVYCVHGGETIKL